MRGRNTKCECGTRQTRAIRAEWHIFDELLLRAIHACDIPVRAEWHIFDELLLLDECIATEAHGKTRNVPESFFASVAIYSLSRGQFLVVQGYLFRNPLP
jgi:hypothetical protein